MPKSTQHALITWIPGSEDGRREARNLNRKFNNYSVLKAPDKLRPGEGSEYMSLIVVGHRGEFKKDLFSSLVTYLSIARVSWVVLAMCNSSQKNYFGVLSEHNEQHSPAQELANKLNIKVSGTKRDLLFHEVGQGQAFALTLGEILIRSNPNSGEDLWFDCEKQSDIDELTEALSSL
ncbi:hypothetical protein [Iodobacter sp.]|uniref:hypothetical protein n=1 Tax=Iodobacter sp. TaxID=1915058 RepID=UPI0025FA0F09|nr:hypothetical protein [Iodobacter sp.]